MKHYEIRSIKCDGAPYTSHSLIVGGKVLVSRLHAFTDAEIRRLIVEHSIPATPFRVAPFVQRGRKKKPHGADDAND